MESCIVCLESDEDIGSHFTTTSAEWTEKKIQRIVEKHLWWWHLKTSKSKSVQWICCRCWQEISTFHEFYKKVEKAHKYCQPVKKEQHEIKPLEFYSDLLLIPEDKPDAKSDNYEEPFIDIPEVKSEYESSSYEFSLNVENAGSHNSGKNTSSNSSDYVEPVKDIKLSGKTNQKSNICRNKRTKNKQSNTVEKELKCKSNQIDNFFKENEHNLECSICNMPLLDFRSIRTHYRNVHNTRGYALCCGKKFFKRCLLVDHIKVHKDPNIFKCESCTKTFATRRGLETHADTHKDRERKYNCDLCGKSYFNLSVFQYHKLTHMPDIEKQFNCSQCEKKFASEEMRRRHEDRIHGRKNAKVCDVCGKSLISKFSFLRHMEEHAGIQQALVTCDICGVKLTTKYSLSRHKKMRHVVENQQEHICPHCSKVSPNLNAHRNHIEYTHTMKRNHTCHLCEKAFKRPVELKEHLSTHTGEALYSCPHCPRTFISNANMHKHRKIIHRMEWEQSRLKLNKKRGKISPISINTGDDKKVIENSTKVP